MPFRYTQKDDKNFGNPVNMWRKWVMFDGPISGIALSHHILDMTFTRMWCLSTESESLAQFRNICHDYAPSSF